VLPDSVQKAIYLDADTLVCADLSSYVAAFPVAESGFAARKGGAMSSKTWGRGLFPKAAPPLVAGVLFMDLQKLRELGFGDACRRILSKVGPANDQTLINLWCRGVFGQLPPELNMRAEEVSRTAEGVLEGAC
jgi:lipopolysaccharide biosynthesis glycosyltransferase